MIFLRPDYYEKFHCVADKCKATCCQGWQIMIDEESLERYEQEKSDYGKTLQKKIDWEEECFHQDKNKRCAFLQENNLCEMYSRLGEESLCQTCANYPRHIEEFENIREITLSVSCPEVAHILLHKMEPVQFSEEEIETEEEFFEDFDPFYFSYLEDARSIMLQILQNREITIAKRFGVLLQLGEEMQQYLEEKELFELPDLLDSFEKKEALADRLGHIEEKVSDYRKDSEKACITSKERFSFLYELEFLSDDQEQYLTESMSLLYENPKLYIEEHEAFEKYCMINNIHLEIILEQLLVYFFMTYFCGAIYDDNVYGEVVLTCKSVFCIYEMFVAAWKRGVKEISLEEMEQVVYHFSRELEHSDPNLIKMEESVF